MEDIHDYFGIDEAALLGEGGEAEVYALDDERVVRIHRPGTPEGAIRRRKDLLDELGRRADRVRFRIPAVLELVVRDGRFASIEHRLPGKPMLAVLGEAVADRRQLLRSYMNAAREVAELTPPRDWYGDLVREEPIRTRSFLEYILARAHDSLLAAGEEFANVRVLDIADAMIDAPRSLVHMDFFPGNVLVEGGAVAAVLDFSVVSIIGDRRIDPIAAAIYLEPEITPTATDEDRRFARTWLEANELLPLYDPVKRWLAAFWSPARDDESLHRWCRSVLLG